jgi:hypothetical protein
MSTGNFVSLSSSLEAAPACFCPKTLVTGPGGRLKTTDRSEPFDGYENELVNFVSELGKDLLFLRLAILLDGLETSMQDKEGKRSSSGERNASKRCAAETPCRDKIRDHKGLGRKLSDCYSVISGQPFCRRRAKAFKDYIHSLLSYSCEISFHRSIRAFVDS